jgi:hypothetical protein
MVSNTQQTERRRRMKSATVGRAQKKGRARAGTPKFPIHPDGVAATTAAKPAVAGAKPAAATAAKPAAATAAKPAAATAAAKPATTTAAKPAAAAAAKPATTAAAPAKKD